MTFIKEFAGAMLISVGAMINLETIWYIGIPIHAITIFIGLYLIKMDSND